MTSDTFRDLLTILRKGQGSGRISKSSSIIWNWGKVGKGGREEWRVWEVGGAGRPADSTMVPPPPKKKKESNELRMLAIFLCVELILYTFLDVNLGT